jgi:lysosomal Pro-X carboxypeptidase
LAASAPIGYYSHSAWASHDVTQFTWIDIVQNVFSTTEHGGEACFNKLKASVSAVAAMGATAAGRAALAKQSHLCSPDVLGADPTNFLIDALETLPQSDYPYAIGSLPAWPVNATCAAAASIDDPIALAVNVTDMFYGYNGADCIDGEGQGGIPGGGPGPASWGPWGYQSCTETLHQFSSSVTTGHGFRDFDFSLGSASQTCQQLYQVQPNPRWAEQRWGGFHIGDGHTGVTNLIWSNGGLDPWHGGGFLRPFENTDELHWFFLPEGAHHLDLRGPHPADPANVTATRAAQETILRGWIENCPQLG